MENTYENSHFSKRNRSERCRSPTEPETEDDVYMNTLQQRLQPSNHKASSSFGYKIIISALALLTLGALSALCAVGILYHNKVASNRTLSEKYENVTAALMELGYRAKETEQLYETMKAKYQRDYERLSACSANENKGWKCLVLKSYYFSTEKLNWTQSRDYCVEKGAHLVIITSQAEQDFVFLQIKETHWIGLNDLETEGKWMWVNNQPLTETGVTLWYISPKGVSEPDNWNKEDTSGENCAALGHEYAPYHTNKWFDASCRKLKLFICEK